MTHALGPQERKGRSLTRTCKTLFFVIGIVLWGWQKGSGNKGWKDAHFHHLTGVTGTTHWRSVLPNWKAGSWGGKGLKQRAEYEGVQYRQKGQSNAGL